VNNAGRGISRSVADLTDEDLDAMWTVNMKSVIYGIGRVVPPASRGLAYRALETVVRSSDTARHEREAHRAQRKPIWLNPDDDGPSSRLADRRRSATRALQLPPRKTWSVLDRSLP